MLSTHQDFWSIWSLNEYVLSGHESETICALLDILSSRTGWRGISELSQCSIVSITELTRVQDCAAFVGWVWRAGRQQSGRGGEREQSVEREAARVCAWLPRRGVDGGALMCPGQLSTSSGPPSWLSALSPVSQVFKSCFRSFFLL